MTHLEIALIVALCCAIALVGLIVDRVVYWREVARAAQSDRADVEASLRRAGATIGGLVLDLRNARERGAKAERDLAVACSLRPYSHEVVPPPTPLRPPG